MMKKDTILSGMSYEDKKMLMQDKLHELSAGYQAQLDNEEVKLDTDELEHMFEIVFFVENLFWKCANTDYEDAIERIKHLHKSVELQPWP